MRVTLATRLPCPADEAWAAVRRPALLEHVAWPLLRFVPLVPDRFPETWAEGDYRVALRLFGIVPLGTQHIVTSIAPDEPGDAGPRRTIRDDGRGTIARRWDHRISIAPAPGGGTDYVDVVDVEAGVLTPGVWLFAQLFYRWRQHRWRRLAAAGFTPLRRPRAR